MPADGAAAPAAKSPAGADANGYGPPRRTETSERSVPSVGGPLCCLSRSCPRAQSDGADLPAGSGECRTRARADGPAGGAPLASGAPVLRWQRDRDPLAPLLAPAGQHRSSPARGHTGSEPMLVDAALVPWPIRRLHPDTLRQSEPGKLVRETGQVKRREKSFGDGDSGEADETEADEEEADGKRGGRKRGRRKRGGRKRGGRTRTKVSGPARHVRWLLASASASPLSASSSSASSSSASSSSASFFVRHFFSCQARIDFSTTDS
jgi:hypothetical protein